MSNKFVNSLDQVDEMSYNTPLISYIEWDEERWDDRLQLLHQMWKNGFADDEIICKIITDLIVHAHDMNKE